MISFLRPKSKKVFIGLWVASLVAWCIWSIHLFQLQAPLPSMSDLAASLLNLLEYTNQFKGDDSIPNYTLK